MALVIRLRQQGRVNRQSYRLVVTDRRAPRDGKYIEKLGWYDPFIQKDNCIVKPERIEYWLEHGAEMTPKAKALIARVSPDVMKSWQEKKRTKQKKKKTAKK